MPCKAKLRTRISTDSLFTENLPEHDHGNSLLKDSTQCAEDKVIMFSMSEAGCNIMKTHGLYMFDGTFKSYVNIDGKKWYSP